MPPRPLFAAAVVGAVAAFALLLLLLVQLSDSESADRAGRSEARSPRLTFEGVIALVSRENAGCPDQPALTLTAEAVYNGDGTWTVTYSDYAWTVDEDAGSVRPISDPLPCPRR